MRYVSSCASAAAVLLGWALIDVSATRAAELRAGVAAQDISQQKPTRPVHDPPQMKALVVDNGQTCVAIVCLDAGGVSTPLTAAIRKHVQRQTRIKPECVLVNASHDHHGVAYGPAEGFAERAAQLVKRAADTAVPVRVGAGSGREDRVTMNRRLRLVGGKAWTIRRATPSPPDGQVAAVGPFDPEIGVLRLDRADGKPLAVLYNFAVHPYGGVPSHAITADLPGFASRVIEGALGDGAVALFVQGCAGDVTPVLYKDVDAPVPTERLGTMLGLSTLAAARKIQTRNDATVKALSQSIRVPRRSDLPERIRSLEAQQEEILKFFSGTGCGAHGAGTFLNFKTFLPLYLKQLNDVEHPAYASYRYLQEESTNRSDLRQLDAENKKRVEKYLAAIEQMEKLIRVRGNLQALQRRQRQGTEPIDVEVQGIRIGDFVLVTFPGEPFAEVGMHIKQRSPLANTFVAGYSNGHLGYAPTADAYSGEAYEDVSTPLGSEWQGMFETKALEIIGQLQTPTP